VHRFGLGSDSERETLEAIGDRSSITRERVRQIEEVGLDAIRASKAFKEARSAFEEIVQRLVSFSNLRWRPPRKERNSARLN